MALTVIERALEQWHRFIATGSTQELDEVLSDDVVFYSPIVYTPQEGKDITLLYLEAAAQTLGGEGHAGFRYTKQVVADDVAVLEFETTVDSKYVNGVDIIRCDQTGRIVELRVMLRPLQAVNVVHERMQAMLASMR